MEKLPFMVRRAPRLSALSPSLGCSFTPILFVALIPNAALSCPFCHSEIGTEVNRKIFEEKKAGFLYLLGFVLGTTVTSKALECFARLASAIYIEQPSVP